MTIKHSLGLLILCENKILLKLLEHEGYEILDIFGSFLETKENAIDKAEGILKEAGITHAHPITPHGTILNIVHKPKENVELHVHLYKVEIKVSDLPINPQFQLCSKDVSEDPRARRIRNIINLAFKDQPQDIFWEENQFGKWIDSETIEWKTLNT